MLAETWPVMLDFDGPVTYLFINGRNRIVAITDSIAALADLIRRTN